MLYQLLKPIVTIAVHIFYKKIEIVNRKQLNEQGPTLIVSNHNNAFLDAVVVEMFARPQIYSLARGDVFKNYFLRAVFSALRIIPIYRKDEVPDMLEKNEATFETCTLLLEQKQHLLMYPEGDCVTEKRLRKLKKGAARIALRAEAKNNFELNIRVLPVGLNYSAVKNFRSKLFVNIGEPISLREYQELYANDSVKAINSLTQYMEQEMRALLVDVQQHSNDQLYQDVLEIYKPRLMRSMNLKADKLEDDHRSNCQIANAINYFQQHRHSDLENFKHRIRDYHQALDKLQLPHGLFTKENAEKFNLFSGAKNLFLMGIGMPLHLIGIAFNYLPYRLAYKTADKKVKQIHFHASVNFVIGMFGWIFYFLFQLLIIGLYSKSWLVVLLFAVFIPLLGLYSLKFYSFIKKNFAQWNLVSLVQNDKPVAERLLQHRAELLNELEKAREVYCKEKNE